MERDAPLFGIHGKGRFARKAPKSPPPTCYGAIQRLGVWMVLGTAFFFCHFAFFGADTLDASAIPLQKVGSSPDSGFFSGVHYREFGVNDVATVPPKRPTILYVYEHNIHTGSGVWSRMMNAANLRRDTGPGGVPAPLRTACNGSRLENSLSLAAEEFNTSVFTICPVRRMSIPRNVFVHLISSFNLDRDTLTAAYMEENKVPMEKVNKTGKSWTEFKAQYSPFASLDYMGYASSRDPELPSEGCPLSGRTKGLVDAAVHDTFLPITLDLPCISKKLLSFHLRLNIDEATTANAHSGEGGEGVDDVKGCVDDALAYGMTAKLLKMYDGTNLSKVQNWREFARRTERDCSGIVLQKSLLG